MSVDSAQRVVKVNEELKLDMCQFDTDAPAQGPSSPEKEHFAKNEIEKRAITPIIIARFNPKPNFTYILWL